MTKWGLSGRIGGHTDFVVAAGGFQDTICIAGCNQREVGRASEQSRHLRIVPRLTVLQIAIQWFLKEEHCNGVRTNR
jgi:hypothetical protein